MDDAALPLRGMKAIDFSRHPTADSRPLTADRRPLTSDL